MSRFGLKKTSESPAVPKQVASSSQAQSNALSRNNYGSTIGPVKANTQFNSSAAYQSTQQRNASSNAPHHLNTMMGDMHSSTGMYVIQTDIDLPNKAKGGANLQH